MQQGRLLFFLVVFLAINVAIYWLLCNFLTSSLFSAADSNALSVSTAAVKAAVNTNLQKEAHAFLYSVFTLRDSAKTISYLAPPFIALTYFGLGANTLTIGSVKINFYGKLLQMVENLLPAKMSVWTDVKMAIREVDLERQQILQHLHSLRNEASRNQWDALEDEWREIEVKSEHLDQRCNMLEKHLAVLNSGNLDQEIIRWMKEDTLRHLEDSRKRVLNLYKGYLADFICVNLRDEGHIKSVLTQMGIPHVKKQVQPINVHYRCLLMGILAGMIIGPISAMSKHNPDVVPVMMVAGVVAVGLSNLIFSFIHDQFKLHEPLDSVYSVLPIGLLAGYVGHFIFILIQFVLSNRAVTDLVFIPLYSLLGGFYGAALAVVLWAYNYWLLPLIRNGFLQVGLLGTCGALALYVTIFPTRSILANIHKITIEMWGVAAIGFFMAVFLGYGLGLLGEGGEVARRQSPA